MAGIPAIAYAGMQAVGGAVSAYGSYQQGKQEQKAYDYNAQIAERSAEAARIRAKLNEYQKMKAAKTQVGFERGIYAKAGVAVDTGSPLDAMVESLSNAYLDIAIDSYNNKITENQATSEASMSRYYGKQAKSAGMFKAGMTLLETAGNFQKTRIGA